MQVSAKIAVGTRCSVAAPQTNRLRVVKEIFEVAIRKHSIAGVLCYVYSHAETTAEMALKLDG
jgi:hypothetical protein